MKDNNRKIVRNSIIYAVGNLGTKIITFLIVPLYTYYISTEDMGDYDLMVTNISLLTPLITFRISDAAYRWMLNKEENETNCISATYRVLAFTSIITPLLILSFNYYVPIPYCSYFIVLLLSGRWLESIQTLVRGLNRQKAYAASGIIYSSLFVGLNVIKVAILHEGITALMQSSIASQLITILVLLLIVPELRKGNILEGFASGITRQFLKYSAPLVPSGLSWWVMHASDRYVIRYFIDKSAQGIYSVSGKFPAAIMVVFTIFNYAWTDVAISDNNEKKELSDYFSDVFEKMYMFSLSLCCFLIPATKIMAELILNGDYKVGAVYIGFLYVGAVFQGFTTFISAMLLKGAKTTNIAFSSMVGAIVNFIVDVLLINIIGIHAASISTFLGFFIMWLLRMREVSRVAIVRINKDRITLGIIITIICASICIFTNTISDLCLTFVFGLFFVVYNRHFILKVFNRIRNNGSGSLFQ